MCRAIYMWLDTIPYVSFPQCYSIIIDRDISSPVHGKEVVDGFNAIGKRYMYKLMSNVQLTGSRTFDSQILMNSCRHKKNDVSLAKESQRRPSKEHRKHGTIDQGKYRKIASKRRYTDREYHVQDNTDVAHKDVKIYCDTNQFPELPFCG